MLEITAVVIILGILAAMGAAGVYAVRTIGDMKITTVPTPAPTESQDALSDRVTALTERIKKLEGEQSAWEQRTRSLMGTVGKLKQQIEFPEREKAVDNEADLDDLLTQHQQQHGSAPGEWRSPPGAPTRTRQVRRR